MASKVKVKVKKSQLDYFRKLARDAAPLEVQACLIGEVVSPQLTVIESFAYPMQYHTQTTETVRWFRDDYEAVKRDAEERGKRIVGDLHSHPEWDAVMSPHDYKAHIEECQRVSGICSVYGRKTRVRFWLADCALPCEIVYATK